MSPRSRCAPLALLLLFAAASASAATGDPIRSNRYAVEVFQGPVLAPLRVTGLAGAYAGYAEGVDGIPSNAAAPALREPYSVHQVDYDLSFGLAFPGAFRDTDFDNDGTTGFAYEDFIFYTVGAQLQAGAFGVGALLDTQRYMITPDANEQDPQSSSLSLTRLDATAAYALWGHQVVIGAGARVVWLNINASTAGVGPSPDSAMVGAAPQAGIVVRPDYQPWRLGATFRAAVMGDAGGWDSAVPDSEGVMRAAGFAVPQSIHLPWEVRAGFSLQLGPRPLNPQWIEPASQERAARERLLRARQGRRAAQTAELAAIAEPVARQRRAQVLAREEAYLQREEDARLERIEQRMLAERRARYWNWPRQYVLVVAEALVTGPSPNAVSLESFLYQREQRVGDRATVTPKLGLEGEPVVERVKTRFGTYVEPSRIRGRAARQHFTFGFDVRVVSFPGWAFLAPVEARISAVVDLAPRYENFGLSFGAWH